MTYTPNDSSLLRSLSHYGPVTAVKFWNNFLFCGYGPRLKIFSVSESLVELVFGEKIFHRNKIHHIAVSQDGSKVMVSGGRSFAVMATFSTKFQEKAVNEWIITTEFRDNNRALVLTSHNTVYEIDVSDVETFCFCLKQKLDCNEKSILYSGSIRVGHQDGRARAVVAAGTVMDGTIVWDLDSCRIIHRLTDHKGSIFGVQIDSDFQHLVSCSDDRSVKLYDFGSGTVLAEGWGHGSRIWSLSVFDSRGTVRIMSCGEDGTARVWSYHEGSHQNHHEGSHELRQIEVIDDCHLGKHVWCGDINTELNMAVTGGADGRIRLHDLDPIDKSTEIYTMTTISQQTGITFQTPEMIKHYAEVDNNLIAITSRGRVIGFNYTTKTWQDIGLSEEERSVFDGFSVLRSINNVVIVTCRKGRVLVLYSEESGNHKWTKKWYNDELKANNKVTNVITVSGDNEHYVLTDSPNPQVPFRVQKFSLDFELIETFTLNQPQQTSFTTTCGYYHKQNQWLIIGSRYSSVVIYDLKNGGSKLYKKLAPGDTITSITPVEEGDNEVTVLITIRDGVYLYARVTKREVTNINTTATNTTSTNTTATNTTATNTNTQATNTFNLDILHENKLTRGFIEGGMVYKDDVILYGFRLSYFYVWNETKLMEVFKEMCGGSHREWALFCGGGNGVKVVAGTGTFVYINKSNVCIAQIGDRLSNSNYGLLNEVTHGREIRDISVGPEIKQGSRIIATASEDTTIRIGQVFADGRIINHFSMNHHVSGLQKVKFLDDTYMASAAANEDFFIWKISRLNNGNPLVKRCCVLKSKSDIPDLRVMDFDCLETEFGFVICAVYSDSSIRIMEFVTECNTLTVLVEDRYSTCCILHTKFITVNHSNYIVIASTDGTLAMWNVSDKLKQRSTCLGAPIIKQQLHQSGIKGMEVVLNGDYSDNTYNIITGGDDNSLIYSQLSLINDEFVMETKSFIEGAASSTITCVAKAGDKQVAVTSVDQVVRLWSYDSGELECEAGEYTTIADTAGCEVSDIGGVKCVVIVGAGLSVWGV